MKLKKWALIAEILGAAAVVISLVFVGYQLMQSNEQAALNTQALEMAAYQRLIERISEFNLATIQSAELRSAREKVQSGEQLSVDETSVLNAFLYMAYRNGDLAYMQYERGMIDEERLRSGLGLLYPFLYLPYVQEHWKNASNGFVGSYRNYVDGLIDEINSTGGPTNSEPDED